jgi:hypothetical protein
MIVTDEMIAAAIAHKYGDIVANEKMRDKMRALLESAIQVAWVSVDDRLPPVDTEVITTDKWGNVATDSLRPVDSTCWYNDGWHYQITHWMPKPKHKGE